LGNKADLKADLIHISSQMGGSSPTRQARDGSLRTFGKAMEKAGLGIRSAAQIGGRHLTAFVEQRQKAGVSDRTLANNMAHVRTLLEFIGKDSLARDPAYSNEALGIGKGSRIGTKEPLTDKALADFKADKVAEGRPGIALTLELQQFIGLRMTEAIRGGNLETLNRWERELTDKGLVHVVEGTKGGRPRDTHVTNQAEALRVIGEAKAVLKAQGGGYLVRKADGSAAKGLKQAQSIYRNLAHRAGIQTHSARVAFSHERLSTYKAEGLGQREARAALSMDLGHGDGRARYVASVYVRKG
jgi:site-specific recombinase XerC